ncbi:MAG: hypothetical protein LVQ95_00815 [Candidatus Micrarchaeales archaeon]|nr:hypothetical protein [Candidatus Micrarchaeales archaeon]
MPDADKAVTTLHVYPLNHSLPLSRGGMGRIRSIVRRVEAPVVMYEELKTPEAEKFLSGIGGASEAQMKEFARSINVAPFFFDHAIATYKFLREIKQLNAKTAIYPIESVPTPESSMLDVVQTFVIKKSSNAQTAYISALPENENVDRFRLRLAIEILNFFDSQRLTELKDGVMLPEIQRIMRESQSREPLLLAGGAHVANYCEAFDGDGTIRVDSLTGYPLGMKEMLELRRTVGLEIERLLGKNYLLGEISKYYAEVRKEFEMLVLGRNMREEKKLAYIEAVSAPVYEGLDWLAYKIKSRLYDSDLLSSVFSVFKLHLDSLTAPYLCRVDPDLYSAKSERQWSLLRDMKEPAVGLRFVDGMHVEIGALNEIGKGFRQYFEFLDAFNMALRGAQLA